MITPEYKVQLVELHKRQIWGAQGWKCLPDVLKLILQFKLRQPTLLDYGAGEMTLEGWASWALPQLKVTNYDPGMPGIDKLPNGQFDIVTCTDVMEHVEEQFVDSTLTQLRQYTNKATIFYIACTPAKAILPDGRNAHLTVHPPEWWMAKITPRWSAVEIIKSSGKMLVCYAYP